MNGISGFRMELILAHITQTDDLIILYENGIETVGCIRSQIAVSRVISEGSCIPFHFRADFQSDDVFFIRKNKISKFVCE